MNAPTTNLAELRAANAAAMKRLQLDGVMLDPLQLLKERLDLLTDVLVELNIINGDAFEEDWERLMAQVFADAESQVARTKLGVVGDGQQLSLADTLR